MADEWWSSTRTGDGASVPATDQQDAAEPAAATDYFRPSLHAAEVDWTQAYMGGGTAAAEATDGFNALLQLHGDDDAGRHFLLDQQPDAVGGATPVAPAGATHGASLYADNQYSSYGNVPAAPMTTKPFSQQQHFVSGFFASSTRNFGDVPSVPPPMTTRQLLLQAIEQKAFKSHTKPVQDACSSATRSVPDAPAAAKKLRIATPSPLPTFKVRKEKLGDRITALQQLVSPFGKTDTASVLHEAIEYIRFLHDQVASLSSPYLRCGRPAVQVQQLQQQQAKDGGEVKEDLRSRGLCLVPVASTYAVASETEPEFWHPTFGGTFR